MELSIVLPCFNEELNIAETVHNADAWLLDSNMEGEIIVVNDGSTDGTAVVLKKLEADVPALRVLQHGVNRGYGAAVRLGCDAATKEFIAFMDSDGQFNPRDFDRLLPHLTPPARRSPARPAGGLGEGGNPNPTYDVVVGRRLKRADPLKRKLMAKVFGALTFLVLGVWVRDVNCAMKIFRRSVWQRARPTIAMGGVFNAELFYRLKCASISWKQVEVPHYPRQAGVQTGGSIRVVLRALGELVRLRAGVKHAGASPRVLDPERSPLKVGAHSTRFARSGHPSASDAAASCRASLRP